FIAGFIMPLLPETMITNIVGENTVLGNVVASVFGAFMYFSTLTEIPILQALMEKGMHSGPALALLLAGPSLSLPNMLVVRSVLGNKKTAVYIGLVVVFASAGGLLFGSIV
ncbi:MAG: permease, partial [Candidatus Woesearchaeota archaeon]